MSKRRKLSRDEREAVHGKTGGHCAYCGCDLAYKDMQVEHVKPLSICGSDTMENMLPACRSCNHYKSTLDIEDFRKYLGGLHERMLRDNVNYRMLNRYGIILQAKTSVQFYFEEECRTLSKTETVKCLEIEAVRNDHGGDVTEKMRGNDINVATNEPLTLDELK